MFIDILLFMVGMVVTFYAGWSVYLSGCTLTRVFDEAALKGEPRNVTRVLSLPFKYLWLALDYGAGVLLALALGETPKKERLAMSAVLRYHSANSEGKRARIAKIILKLLKPFRER